MVAVLYDRFFRDDYTGPWIAVGAEYWWSRIGLKAGEGRGAWSTPVATVGAGWVFPIWRGLYLNPWGAGHAPLDASGVTVGGEPLPAPGLRGRGLAQARLGCVRALSLTPLRALLDT